MYSTYSTTKPSISELINKHGIDLSKQPSSGSWKPELMPSVSEELDTRSPTANTPNEQGMPPSLPQGQWQPGLFRQNFEQKADLENSSMTPKGPAQGK